MVSINGAVTRAIRRATQKKMPRGVSVYGPGSDTTATLVKIEVGFQRIVRVSNWVMNTRTKVMKARATYYPGAVVDNSKRQERVFTGNSPDDIIQSVAAALAMGAFGGDHEP